MNEVVVDSNNDPSSLLQQSYPLEGKSSTGSNQEDSGTTGSQAKKRRVGRPRKHAKLIEDDSHIELVGGTSKSNTENHGNEISSRPIGGLNGQDSHLIFQQFKSSLYQGGGFNDTSANQDRVGQKRSKRYEAETDEPYLEEHGA